MSPDRISPTQFLFDANWRMVTYNDQYNNNNTTFGVLYHCRFRLLECLQSRVIPYNITRVGHLFVLYVPARKLSPELYRSVLFFEKYKCIYDLRFMLYLLALSTVKNNLIL